MDPKKPEIPKDLGVKIGNEEEAFWTTIKNKCEKSIQDSEHEIEINRHIQKHAEIRIAEEKENFK